MGAWQSRRYRPWCCWLCWSWAWRAGSSRWRRSCRVGGIGWRWIGRGNGHGARSCAGACRGGRGHGKRGCAFCPSCSSCVCGWRVVRAQRVACAVCGVSVPWVVVAPSRERGPRVSLVRLDWRSDQDAHQSLYSSRRGTHARTQRWLLHVHALIGHRSIAPQKTVPLSIEGARLSLGQRHPLALPVYSRSGPKLGLFSWVRAAAGAGRRAGV